MNDDIYIEDLNRFVGLTIDDSEVSTFLNSKDVRIWYPKSIYGSDYIAGRLNVDVDKNRYIERFWWG